MWKTLLCTIGVQKYCVIEHDEHVRMIEKIKIVLYRANTLEQLQLAKKLLKKYEKILQNAEYPLTMVAEYSKLLKLWEHKFKLWKRG
jgi:hypothetical protein